MRSPPYVSPPPPLLTLSRHEASLAGSLHRHPHRSIAQGGAAVAIIDPQVLQLDAFQAGEDQDEEEVHH